MRLFGADEAGRGPIIGPMVMCGIVVPHEKEANLANMGVKDSKALTPLQRERLFDNILDIAEHKIVVVQPAEIDAAVLSDSGMNLNWLEAQKYADLINALKPDEAIIDCPSPNIPAYKDYLSRYITVKAPGLVCAHHADADHPVVAAASIIAKVTRDRLVGEIKKSIGIDFGSGYISDPRTKAFLLKHWDTHHGIFRHSWAPYQKVAGIPPKKGQKALNSFDE